MSSSRSPEDKADPSSEHEEEGTKSASPGRYSMATEGSTEMAAVRIDSTHMQAVQAVRLEDEKPIEKLRPSEKPKPLETTPAPGHSGPVKKPTLKLGGLMLPAPGAAPGAPEPEPGAKPRASVAGRPPPLPQRQAPKPEKEKEKEKPPDSQREIARIALKKQHDRESTRTAAAALASGRPPSSTPPPPPLAPPAQKERSTPPPRSPSVAPPPLGPRPGSLKPPPPPKKESRPPSELDGFDEGSIMHAFDALMSDQPSQPGLYEVDLTPVRELFAELAANHMRHVRDFMIDVKWGEVTRDWIEICVPPIRTLRRAAERLDLAELGTALERLGVALEAASSVGAPTLTDAEKAELLEAYGDLVTLMPQAFALDRDRSQREAVIVQALLLQVPDVRKVTIDKLHASGLTSLRELFDANAHDMAQVAGIPHALAARIVERVRAYREELSTASPSDARAAEREKLAGLTRSLRDQHEGYEEAATGWSADAKTKKRDCFRQREETWLAISVLLARFGEVDRLRGIEKVPFAQRIAQLAAYLEEAAEKYAQLD